MLKADTCTTRLLSACPLAISESCIERQRELLKEGMSMQQHLYLLLDAAAHGGRYEVGIDAVVAADSRTDNPRRHTE